VDVSYANMQTKTTDRLTSAIAVRFSTDPAFCDARRNDDVLEKSVLLIANDQNQLATQLRDQGKLDEAQSLLISNSRFLEANAIKLKSDLLKLWCAENLEQAQYLDDENWNKTRKRMVQRNNAVKVQQRGYGEYGGAYGSNTKNK